MSDRLRITLTLPADVVTAARELSEGNLSRWVTAVLRRDLEQRRRADLRRAMAAGYEAEADLDLQICEEFRHIDDEVEHLSESGS